ncbi:MAG: cobalt ECF transporter T component CbiQ [Nitrospiraceae bacterium]|nr:cobalt ECF transporter T component CbiQ [Nitrospiraceae bacterium]
MKAIEKGISAAGRVITQAYAQWETASAKGLMQSIDPRVKLLFLISFILLVSIRKEPGALLCIFAFVMALALFSRVDMISFLKKIVAIAFFFGLLVGLPAVLNIFVQGDVVLKLFSFSRPYEFLVWKIPAEIGITEQGLYALTMLTLRVLDSAALSLLVVFTTPFQELLRALKVIRTPDVMIVTAALSYKYVFLFARTVSDMHLGKKSRTLCAASAAEERRWAADRMALLFKKTTGRCEAMHSAMVSRGLSDGFRVMPGSVMNSVDKVALAVVCISAGIFMFL